MLNQYTKEKWKKQLPVFIAMLALAIMVILTAMIPEPVTKADVEYPMANAHITWEQSFHNGGFEQ